MKRITFTKPNGEWGIEGVDMKKITPEVYGALYKLKRYEDLNLSPEEIERKLVHAEAEGIKIPFKAYTASNALQKWEGEIMLVQVEREPYEVEISARDSTFRVLIGHHSYGSFIYIPNWNVGTEIVFLSDVFWNRERLEQYTKLNEVDASSVACGIAALGEYFDIE